MSWINSACVIRSEVDLQNNILDDLRHLESVVSNKITEIEVDLEKLTWQK